MIVQILRLVSVRDDPRRLAVYIFDVSSVEPQNNCSLAKSVEHLKIV